MARLTGKVALITGAAGGQGTAEAELFLREEAAVVLADIDVAAGERLARWLAGQGSEVLFLRQDVADEASWQEVVAAALTRFGKLHILVNNAGTIARQGIVDTTLEAWNRTIAVNLTGAMLGMKHCAPAIRDSGGGSGPLNMSMCADAGSGGDATTDGRDGAIPCAAQAGIAKTVRAASPPTSNADYSLFLLIKGSVA